MSNLELQLKTNTIKIKEIQETQNQKIRAKVSQKVRIYRVPKVMEVDLNKVQIRPKRMMEIPSKKVEGQMQLQKILVKRQ